MALGTGGQVTAFNAASSVDVILDLNGWFDPVPRQGTVAGEFVSYQPTRLLDTRTPTGGHPARLGPGDSLDLQVANALPGIYFPSGLAAVLNLTAVEATDFSYLEVYPKGADRPTASNLNFPPHRNLANRVQVRLSPDGAVTIYNGSGYVDVLVDLNGWYLDGTYFGIGTYFHPMAPVRVMDTRPPTQVGPIGSLLQPGSTSIVQVAGGASGVPMAGLSHTLVLNVTAVAPSDGTFITLYPAHFQQPTASDLNVNPGENLPNLVVVSTGIQNGQIAVYVDHAFVDLVIDVAGYYA